MPAVYVEEESTPSEDDAVIKDASPINREIWTKFNIKDPLEPFEGLTVFSPGVKISDGIIEEHQSSSVKVHDARESSGKKVKTNQNQQIDDTCAINNCCYNVNNNGKSVCRANNGNLQKFVVNTDGHKDGIDVGGGFKLVGQIHKVCLKETYNANNCTADELLDIKLVRWCDGVVGALFQNIQSGSYLTV